jgi:hypothetical protein
VLPTTSIKRFCSEDAGYPYACWVWGSHSGCYEEFYLRGCIIPCISVDVLEEHIVFETSIDFHRTRWRYNLEERNLRTLMHDVLQSLQANNRLIL